MLRILAFALIFYLGHNSAFSSGDPCFQFRLDEPGGVMAEVPVHDQRGVGNCYANAATSLFDSFRLAHQDFDGGPSSPLASSILFTEDRISGFKGPVAANYLNAGGQVCDTVRVLMEQGACSKSNVDGQLSMDSYSILMSDTYRFYSEFERGDPFSSRRPERFSAIVKKNRNAVDGLACGLRGTNLLKTDLEIKELLEQTSYHQMLSSIILDKCKVRTLPKNRGECEYISSPKASKWTMMKTMEDHFLKSRLPLGIVFCARVLREGKSCQSVGNLNRSQVHPDCGHHAVLLIGRRQNSRSGQCEYLIRNSWGTECSYYSKDWECDNGNIWIEQEALVANTYQFFRMKE